MKVTMKNYQPANSRPYKNQTAASTAESEVQKNPDILAATGTNQTSNPNTGSQINISDSIQNQKQEEESFLSALLGQAKESSNFKVSVSMPDDSTGQLASELANSETKMNVLQVSTKAMRALANLKMSYALSEGKDKEKIAQMIRRMEKLTKKIQKKMKNLAKEEQLELRRKRAKERQELEKELEIRNEISRKKKKRHREERNYANKEMNEDRKEAMQETLDAMAASMSGPSSSSGLSAMAGVSGTAASAAAIAVGTEAYAASADVPMMEGASIDVAI